MKFSYQIIISGVVQGVGFRPFIYNLANRLNIDGYVTNSSSGVLIELSADKKRVDEFILSIRELSPPLSNIDSIEIKRVTYKKRFEGFEIQNSINQNLPTTKILSDISMCEKCQMELDDRSNRRFNYPFINCTNCGVRYSIIKNLPYDRDQTS
ncbi:MAG: acylphosphatase [Campylobacterota bacterium]|nr:acylphosphatase [Campylobacterota bacterium]